MSSGKTMELGSSRKISVRRLVVKVGTYTLVDRSGRLDRGQLRDLVDQVAGVRRRDIDVVLVSSGAIAAGVELLGLPERPKDIPSLQAASSVGQGLLLHLYTDYFSRHGILVGQVLLTQYDFFHRRQYLNARNTFLRLMEQKVVPVVNENDAVATEEIRFGDNDRLAALVSVMVGADLLVMLSDIPGLYTADPKRDPKAEFIPEVERITESLIQKAGGSCEEHSSGGMITKLEAARMATSYGVGMIVAHGKEERVLERILEGEVIGTYFHARKKRIKGQKHWIAFGSRPRGCVVVDEGAREALVKRGKSLLPAGVLECRGDFAPGDPVEVRDPSGKLVAKGIISCSREELEEIKGLRTDQAARILGEDRDEEVIHRDYLVVLVEGED